MTPLYHFTDIEHLATIVSGGLLADSTAGPLIRREAGSLEVKRRRRDRVVTVPPGGYVCDYVPFYFAPRSPMMYAISGGQVEQYGTDTSNLVYLITSVESLAGLGYLPVFTRRNAALINAEFRDDLSALETHIDWEVMRDRYWRDTPADQDRRARRMAEWLVHDRVEWQAFMSIAVRTAERARFVREILTTLKVTIPIQVEPDWYF